MKNFYLDDSNKLMAVWLISAFWAQKAFDSYFIDMVYVDFMKNTYSPIPTRLWLLDSFRST